MRTLLNEYRLIKQKHGLSGPSAIRFMVGNLIGGFGLSRTFWS